MSAELLVLRILHIGLGAFWVGSLLFNILFVGPAMKAAGPAAAGPIMGHMMRRGIMIVMPTIAILTILSGLRLMMIASGGNRDWFLHRAGHAYSVAGALAIIAFLVGMFILRPAMEKAGTLGRSAASDGASREMISQEIDRLQRRALRANAVVATLLVLATIGMAVARYL